MSSGVRVRIGKRKECKETIRPIHWIASVSCFQLERGSGTRLYSNSCAGASRAAGEHAQPSVLESAFERLAMDYDSDDIGELEEDQRARGKNDVAAFAHVLDEVRAPLPNTPGGYTLGPGTTAAARNKDGHNILPLGSPFPWLSASTLTKRRGRSLG